MNIRFDKPVFCGEQPIARNSGRNNLQDKSGIHGTGLQDSIPFFKRE